MELEFHVNRTNNLFPLNKNAFPQAWLGFPLKNGLLPLSFVSVLKPFQKMTKQQSMLVEPNQAK
jgi:hypothetical protein